MTGFEPATSASQTQRSTKLSYIPQAPSYHARKRPSQFLRRSGRLSCCVLCSPPGAARPPRRGPRARRRRRPQAADLRGAARAGRRARAADLARRQPHRLRALDRRLQGRPHRTELVLVEVASGARRVLTHDRIGAHAPRWSPSGDRIAYLASPARGKPAQLYVLPMSGGDSEKITDGQGRPRRASTGGPTATGSPTCAQDDPPEDEGARRLRPGVPGHRRALPHPRAVAARARLDVGADGKGAKQITKGELAPRRRRRDPLDAGRERARDADAARRGVRALDQDAHR